MTNEGALRALVVHESMFGNTAEVAEAVARGLRQAGMETMLSSVDDVGADEALRHHLVVVGAPTHAFSLSREGTRRAAVEQGAPQTSTRGMRDWLDGLPDAGPADAPWFAAFDTRVTRVSRIPKAAATRATTLLRRKGYRLISAPTGFQVADIGGPVVPGEDERAAAWGRLLATTVLGGAGEAPLPRQPAEGRSESAPRMGQRREEQHRA